MDDQNLRVLSDNIQDYERPWETSSLDAEDDCGVGERNEDCDPNDSPTDNANPDPVTLVGWYFDLPLDGERVVSNPLIRQGKVIYIAFTPEETPCGAGGSSVVMEADACSGGRITDPAFDINEDRVIDENDLINIGTEDDPIWVAPTGLQGEGRLQPPVILRPPSDAGAGDDDDDDDDDDGDPGGGERKYFSSSRGDIVEVDEDDATVGIGYWLELE